MLQCSVFPELPLRFRASLCVPRSCERDDVESFISPYYAFAYFCRGIPSDGRPDIVGQVTAVELSHWSKLRLDFAITGADNCGTNSMRMNLQQHPDISFTHPNETDDFFMWTTQRRVLPLLSQVDDFNSRSTSGAIRPALLGLNHGGIFSHGLARVALSEIPHLQVLLVVCDPLGRLEKEFMKYRLCNRSASGQGQPDDGKCAESMAEVLAMPDFLAMQRMAPHLMEMKGLFGERLSILHQDSLRTSPRLTYHGLALLLGSTRPFLSGTSFRRYNSHRGHRTDLCMNASLVQALKVELESSGEYRILEELLSQEGGELPRRLLLHECRCDRPEELAEPQSTEICAGYDRPCNY